MRFVLAILAGGPLLAGLSAPAAIAAGSMAVEVRVQDLAIGELELRIRIEDPEAELRAIRGVPTYVDNPHAAAAGEIVHDLRFGAGEGRVAVRERRTARDEPEWVLDERPATLEMTYRLRVDFEAGALASRYPIHIPGVRDGRAWLSGNHVFLSPVFGEDRVEDLRRPFPVSLRFVLADGLQVHGPPREVELQNLHELLSLQFGLGDFEVLEAGGEGWEGRVILEDAGAFSDREREVLVEEMEVMTAAVAELFGGVPFATVSLYVFRDEGLGGLEGAWAAQAYLPEGVDLADDEDPWTAIFFKVALHELVHTWLPIAVFPRDDPWFKEGVTSHYGHVLAARTGILGPAGVDRIFEGYEAMVFGDVEIEKVGLGDRELWHREYDGESWRRLSYDRGHAVALLLDVHLREESGHRHDLDDVLREMFARRSSRGFDREALLEAIEDATGVDAGPFFSQFVDGVEAPTVREVDRALQKAIRYGVYAEE